MSDQPTPTPKTLVLEPAEWRALTLFSLQALLEALGPVMILNDDGAAQAKSFLERSGQLIEAWRRASHIAQVQAQAQNQALSEAKEPGVNGSTPVRVDITKDEVRPNRQERRRQRKREISPHN